MSALHRSTVYPIDPASWRRLDDLIVKLKCPLPAFCPVCGRVGLMRKIEKNLRESCVCMRCGSRNRQRQLALVLSEAVGNMTRRHIRSLRDVASVENIAIYNTESLGAVHERLCAMPLYTSSEYLGSDHHDVLSGMMHQDLMDLTFQSCSFEFVLSSDVFEHIPDPYKAHREIYRVLKPGGRHIFTVPFYQTEFLDEPRAILHADGSVRLLKDAIYHGDPVRSNGALVFNIFSLEMLVKLNEIGFRTNVYRLHDIKRGILGPNAIVFEAAKN